MSLNAHTQVQCKGSAENHYTKAKDCITYSISQKTWKQSLHGTEVKGKRKAEGANVAHFSQQLPVGPMFFTCITFPI